MEQDSIGVVNKVLQKHFKNSIKYKEEQKPHVRDLNTHDVKYRVLSFFMDAIFMFWPSIIFIISMLLLISPANIGGEIIRNTSDLLTVYIISILFFNVASSLYFLGQTFGMRYYNLKVVKNDNCQLSVFQLLLRELVGFSLPWVAVLLTYEYFGFTVFFMSVLLFMTVNFLIILFDRKHRSLIDFFMGTKIIYLPDEDEWDEILPETIQEAVEEPEMAEICDVKAKEPEEEPQPEKEVVPIEEQPEEAQPVLEPQLEDEAITQEKESPAETPKAKEIPNSLEKEIQQKAENEVQAEPVRPVKANKSVTVEGKSVTEIISEAVSVVDEALEPKQEDFTINIVKPKKKEKMIKTEEKLDEAVSEAAPVVSRTQESEAESVISKMEQPQVVPVTEPVSNTQESKEENQRAETPAQKEVDDHGAAEPADTPFVHRKNNKKKNGNHKKGGSKKQGVDVKKIRPAVSRKSAKKK